MTELKEGPAEKEFHKLFDELNTMVDEAGNLRFKQMVEKHPFPLYEATVRRFRMIRERLPQHVQKSAGIGIEEFFAKVEGAVNELMVGAFDAVWDVVTSPLNLTVFPKMRHPIFKMALTNLSMPTAVRTARGGSYFTPMGDAEAGSSA
ncbi:MAG: hypothetical protein Q8L37_05145 [Candidatus Gottesmanbacteria bacterium]|nr:hypothetical protein [Candidatus Gottesmanbacteria bacterium]